MDEEEIEKEKILAEIMKEDDLQEYQSCSENYILALFSICLQFLAFGATLYLLADQNVETLMICLFAYTLLPLWALITLLRSDKSLAR